MMNKQKTSKLRQWKLLAFLPIFAILLMTSAKCANEPSKLSDDPIKEISEIMGTWKLLSYNYAGDTLMNKFPDNVERIKFITDNSICWIQVSKDDQKVITSAGGTYKLIGENYSEFIEYDGAGRKSITNNEQKFTIKIKNDKLYLSGTLSSGQRIREVWERVASK